MEKATGIEKKTDNEGIENVTDTDKDTDRPSSSSRRRVRTPRADKNKEAKEHIEAVEFEPLAKATPVSPATASKKAYDPAEFASVQAMSSLKGFAPMGMLFILMDILNGSDEGLIRINRLATSLSIGKPAMLAQLDNLEAAGLIRTVSSSQRGRHIELLVPNFVIGKKSGEVFVADDAPPPLKIDNELFRNGMPANFSLDKLKELQNYLTEHGIRVVSIPDESGLDPRCGQIAAFIGKYLSYVQPFYTRLKTTLNEGEEFQFSLLGFQGRDVTHTLNLCKMLRDIGFLTAFAYRRAPHCKITARVNRTPAAINFLSGGWLEHYIRDKVISILTTHPSTLDMPFAFMKNPRILLPEDEDFEFDFLLTVGTKIFWIEAKTGEYMEFIKKYSRVSKVLGLGRNNNLLVIVDAPKPDNNIAARYDLSCCSVEEFAEVFRLNLVRELGRQSRRR